MRSTLAEPYDTPEQQLEAAELGMWVFLANEALIFGALFTGYTVYRIEYPEAFAEASGHLYAWIGAGNTAVLLASSFTMALAVSAARREKRRRTARMLALTALLGGVFLVIKAFEYVLDYREDLVPLVEFDAARFEHPDHARLFLVFYFVMTGIHFLHLLGGVLFVALLAAMTRFGAGPDRLSNTIEATGLYWHFVDIVWLFLLPLLYYVS